VAPVFVVAVAAVVHLPYRSKYFIQQLVDFFIHGFGEIGCANM